MNLKKLGMALVAVLALGAVMASSALAAATTTDVAWYTGESPGTILSGSESVSASGSATLITTVGETKLELQSTAIECSGCTIKNEGGKAVATGKLVFKNVTAETPAACTVESGGVKGQVITNTLEATPDWMIGTNNYVEFKPEEGNIFAQLKLVGCPIAGTYNVTGNDFLKTVNATGVFAVSQGLTGTGAINIEAGGALKFGGAAAELVTKEAAIKLSGTKAGQKFATK